MFAATGLFMELGFVVAERVLYVPSAGFCLLIAMVVQHMLGESGTVESESTEASSKGGKSGAKKGESEKSVSEASSSTRTMPTIGRLAVVVMIVVIGLYGARFVVMLHV